MKFIAGDSIAQLLEQLAAQGEVWAPRAQEAAGASVLFERWQPGSQVDFEQFTHLSAKELLMPPTEKIFSFGYSMTEAGERLGIENNQPGQSRDQQQARSYLFAGRACDARAIRVLDALFGEQAQGAYNDPAYRARRAGLTVLTLACTSCDAACFCSSFEGPGDQTGSDVFLYPVEGGYLFEAITPAGEEIVAGDLFTESDQAPPPLAETARIDLGGLQQKLPEVFSELEYWQQSTGQCLSCGYCTYACPTCHCFNIFDEMRTDRAGDRLRGWDACMFHQYTLEASGHNPRPTSAHRYRNRISHKFSYYPANQGETLCTGCGRCIRGCPAGLDIRDVLTGAKEL